MNGVVNITQSGITGWSQLFFLRGVLPSSLPVGEPAAYLIVCVAVSISYLSLVPVMKSCGAYPQLGGGKEGGGGQLRDTRKLCKG